MKLSKLPPMGKGQHARLTVLAIGMGLFSLAMVARAAYLQLINPDFYQQQGDARFVRDVPISVSRGMIMDRNGEPLAVSSPVESIWAEPRELLNQPKQLDELADALEIPADALKDKLAQRSDREFVYLRRHMNPDVAQAVLARDIAGVHSQREFRRFYPHGEVLAHLLGFTNIDDVGQEGLELAFNNWLTGSEGKKRIIRDRRGREVDDVDLIKPAQSGKDLTLSIDRRIQYLAYRELKNALVEHNASSGSVVVLDVPTGEILAMVNQPSYNPNARGSGKADARRNRAVTDVIEPGSVIKAMTVTAAIENGASPTRQFNTSPGTFQLAGHVIRDIRDFGMVDMTRLLTKSSNIAATKLAMEMSNDHFYDVLQRFGFGKSTGSGFPGESSGVLAQPRTWGVLEKATIAYGYGLSVTPLQIAQAYSVLANQGRLMPPTFVKGGNAQHKPEQVVDPAIARQLITMLETVTGDEGSGKLARITGYRVAGKSGTSRRAVVGGYEKRYISVFAGMVPATNPRLVMVTAINNPRGSVYYGGLVSAPVFHSVMEGALRLLDVPPDNWQPSAPAATLAVAAKTVNQGGGR